MIELKTICAVLHTPSEIVVLGAYQDKRDAFFTLDAAINAYIKDNPELTFHDFYQDWFDLPIGEDVNYVVYVHEEESNE